MVNTAIGNIGHLFVIISFILSLFAAYSYLKSSVSNNDLNKKGWLQNGRLLFYIHSGAVLGVVIVLFAIIYGNHFEYHYAWSHASKTLPFYYKLSCFWEGQEGSFLLWIFWNCILGIILIQTSKHWEGPMMTVFALVQAFLTSMILGAVFFDLKIGSSPFLLLRDVMTDAPVFDADPNFIPEDGTGLNPLLQNYWMVIHPPTLFLGYATTLIPFAYLIAGLWTKNYQDWIKPALPWTIFSVAILGLGQLMGAYWAYETLSFGGYWNWDPVENAVYVPWIIQVAGLHAMIIFKNNNTALKLAMILTVATFILILYATFLTRSGVLGEASVHSFTDLGLNGQLLIYMLTFLAISVYFLIAHWKNIPSSNKEISTYSREFWIFLGAITFCLMGFQVLYATSIPVYNNIIEAFGGTSNIAPPADQVGYFTNIQIWGAVLIAILSGTGQLFYWKKMEKNKIVEALVAPFIIALLVSAIIIVFAKISTVSYIILLTAAVYSIAANGKVLWSIWSKKPSLSGGAIAHIGVAFMLIGILFSSGYSKVVSLNNSGLLYSSEFSDEMNRENVLLFLNEPRQMNEYELIYKGRRKEVEKVPFYVPEYQLAPTSVEYLYRVTESIKDDGEVIFDVGDTVEVSHENTYYEIDYKKGGEKIFTLFPRAQVNPSMGLLVSPDIKRSVSSDLYTHISTIPDPEKEKDWSEPESKKVRAGERFFINDYVAEFKGVERVNDVAGIDLGPTDVAVKGLVEIFGDAENEILEPLFVVKDNMIGNIPEVSEQFGARVSFVNVFPEEDSFELSIQTTQKDYIIMKAIEKPYINVLWLGTFVLMIGFGIATARRFKDFAKVKL